MPTEVISTIGATSSPITPDYSSIQAWEDDIPSDLTTADEIHIGECLDQGNLDVISIDGQTTDSTRYIVLRCATGASFKDKTGVRDGKLNYDDTDGVKCESASEHRIGTPYTKLEGLKICRTAYISYCFHAGGRIHNQDINQCIIKGGVGHLGGPSNNSFPDNNSVIRNSLVYHPDSFVGIGGDGSIINCTVRGAIGSAYGLAYVRNCLVFGSSASQGFSVGETYTGSDYNATDQSDGSTGSNNLLSLNMSNEIESTTDDFRPKITGSLKAGIVDAATAVDITGFTRSSNPYIGCFELEELGGTHVYRTLFGVG